jgi:MFS family permease
VLANAAQNVAVGWFVYDLTHSAWALGLTGLFTFLPMLVLSPITGQLADQYDRRMIVAICTSMTTLVSLALLIYSLAGFKAIVPIYVLVTFIGAARAFSNPAAKALLPNLVPRENFGTAVAWSSSFEQFANTAGPAIGGLLYMLGADVVFGVAACLYAFSAISIYRIKARPEPIKREPVTWQTISAGLRYIYAQKVLFGAISLDMVAVCMGGVTALPIQTQEGWQVLKLDAKRKYKVPTFDESKQQVINAVMASERAEYVQKLVKAAKIE